MVREDFQRRNLLENRERKGILGRGNSICKDICIWKQLYELRNYSSLSVATEGVCSGEWQEMELSKDHFTKCLRFQLKLSSLLWGKMIQYGL